MSQPVGDSIDISASPDAVWSMISNVTRMPEWSPELASARWLGSSSAPVVGAKFRGTNRNGRRRWSTSCAVTAAEPGRKFGYRVSTYGLSVSDWIYEITPTDGGCTLRESTVDQRGFLIKFGGGPVTGVYDRATHNLAGIRATLAAVKAAAERG